MGSPARRTARPSTKSRLTTNRVPDGWTAGIDAAGRWAPDAGRGDAAARMRAITLHARFVVLDRWGRM